ncbi:MAG: LacI family DNA-binding transcriptional regulator [Pseudobutyrivibrio sp.]|uniref:LacI family DNA-binding transcriptional regulator n=1 Tax=Pseudobutyrivibrio sp. TaxID=2014367 RepID=UPI0025E941BD|nr:LacI family DNA-binding transcriptional regulator [Pseudobutyrivibrio sp.]MBQ8488300.1 LacI family DNA-binding transcriptional regulator [Pseudobutyrivibrio sp.]
MAKKAVTQSRIADALGVSRNTVSKALNNEVGVSEELRKKIRDTAIEMGYNKLIVLDEKGGIYKKNIALVCIGNALVDSYWNTFIVALDKRLKSLNYNMTLCFLEEEDDKNLRIPENLSSSYVAGIVFIGVCTKAFAKKMMQLKIPTVFIDTFWDVDINVSCNYAYKSSNHIVVIIIGVAIAVLALGVAYIIRWKKA